MVGSPSRPEQAWRLAELGLPRSPLAHRRVGIGARSAPRLLEAVELAEPIERGAAHAGLRCPQAAAYEPAPRGFVEPTGCVEQPVDERVAVARLEAPGGAQQVVESRRVGPQRAPR